MNKIKKLKNVHENSVLKIERIGKHEAILMFTWETAVLQRYAHSYQPRTRQDTLYSHYTINQLRFVHHLKSCWLPKLVERIFVRLVVCLFRCPMHQKTNPMDKYENMNTNTNENANTSYYSYYKHSYYRYRNISLFTFYVSSLNPIILCNICSTQFLPETYSKEFQQF